MSPDCSLLPSRKQPGREVTRSCLLLSDGLSVPGGYAQGTARWHHLSHGRAQMSFWEHTFYADQGKLVGTGCQLGSGDWPPFPPCHGPEPHFTEDTKEFHFSRELAISWSVFLVMSGMRCFSKSNVDVLMKRQCRAVQLLPALVSWRKVPGTCKFLVFLPGTLLSLGQMGACLGAVCSLRDVRLAGVPTRGGVCRCYCPSRESGLLTGSLWPGLHSFR